MLVDLAAAADRCVPHPCCDATHLPLADDSVHTSPTRHRRVRTGSALAELRRAATGACSSQSLTDPDYQLGRTACDVCWATGQPLDHIPGFCYTMNPPRRRGQQSAGSAGGRS
jgi:hypothetical protein